MSGRGIRIAVGQFSELTDEKLRFAAQVGVKGIQLNNPKLPGDTHWEARDIRALVDRAEEAGLALEAIENVPTHFYHKALLGLPGRDEQIEYYLTTVRNLGVAGVPILGLHFMPNSVWRTERHAFGRGGAGNTKFDMAKVLGGSKDEWRSFMPTTLGRSDSMPVYDEKDGIVTAAMMWANYTYFMDAVAPAADE